MLKPQGVELPGDVAQAVRDLGAGPEPLPLRDDRPRLPRGGGWMVVPPALPALSLAGAVAALTESEDAWGLLLLRRRGDALEVVPLGAFPPGAPSRIGGRLAEGGLSAGVVEPSLLLSGVASIRHDLNNALTSALAETQFLRMDVQDESEIAEGLDLVERQLQRIRALTAELARLRAGGP